MSNNRKEFKQSSLNIQLKFDKGRENDFKIILNEKFGIKAKQNEKDEQATLDRDFHDREEELQVFREGSQSALQAPLLTQAMVKKARLYTASFQVNNVQLIDSFHIVKARAYPNRSSFSYR